MDADERGEMLGEFAARVADAGLLNIGGWARFPREYYEEEEPDYDPATARISMARQGSPRSTDHFD